jgi:hypothetical protein
MTDLTDKAKGKIGKNVPGLIKKGFELKKVGDKWKCVESKKYKGTDTSFHFGCQYVEIKARGEATVNFGEGGYTPPAGSNPKPSDYQVNYADVVGPISDEGKFDADSCKAAFGQGNFLVPIPTDSAAWFMKVQPFDDPFLMTQEKESEPGPIEYATFLDMDCLPNNLKIENTGMPVCPRTEGSPPPNTVELNLFYWASEIGELDLKFPAVLSIETDGNTKGIRIDTDPKEGEKFYMLGGRMITGKMTLCALENPEICMPPQVEEGRTVKVNVNTILPLTVDEDSDTTPTEEDRVLFNQEGYFIKDTMPPLVNSQTIVFSQGKMTVRVVATDSTTSPISSTFWYSTNGGNSWNNVDLESDTRLEEDRTRTFATSIDSPSQNTRIQYFITVEDLVHNTTYFGPKETLVPGGCLIATASYGSELAPQVQMLRELRDNVVLRTNSGVTFMSSFNDIYYTFSPTVAEIEMKSPAFRELVKLTVTPLLSTISILNHVDIDSEQEMLGYGIGIILLNIGMYFVIPILIIYKIKERFKR